MNDIVSGDNLTICPPADGGARAARMNTLAVPGYDLVTGLGSPQCPLIDYLATMQASPWITVTNSSLPCVKEIAGAGMGPAEAWAIGCNTNSGGTDRQIFRLPSLGGSWVQISGGAVHVSVSPAGVPWVINNYGGAYQLENSGSPCTTWSSSCGWVAMNGYGSFGPHSQLSSIAPGPNSTAWATSQTAYEGGPDFTVYYYGGGANGEGAWTYQSGVALQQVSNGFDTLGRNHSGTSFVNGGGSGGSWYPLDIATTDNLSQYSSYNGQAIWIAAGNNAYGGTYAAYAWIITSTPWEYGSSDDMILELVESNTSANNVWMQLPGGATQISAAPYDGSPWVTNAEGVGFVATGYRQ